MVAVLKIDQMLTHKGAVEGKSISLRIYKVKNELVFSCGRHEK